MCVCFQLIAIKSTHANIFDVWILTTLHQKICATSLWVCLEVAVEGEFILQKPRKSSIQEFKVRLFGESQNVVSSN